MEIGDLQEYSAKFLSWFSGYSVLSDIEHNFEVAYSIKYLCYEVRFLIPVW